LDDAARYNVERWSALAAADALWTRPWVDLDEATARRRLDPDGRLGDVRGKDVLCLASGGGQQGPAFALLGANVTSLDLSREQVERDVESARRYDYRIDAFQGDMRDVSRFGERAFDLVWHSYSLNFIPDARAVFDEVRRVLRAGGTYVVMCANPFVAGIGTRDWNGSGYLIRHPYVEGAEIVYRDEDWVTGGAERMLPPPKEYRHTLGTLVGGLSAAGFVILTVEESTHGAPESEPGSWEHLTSFAPPWLRFWCSFRPDVVSSRAADE
jgi:SAM-dependent methyltransferase